MRIAFFILLSVALSAYGQANEGELRLRLIDASGLGVQTQVQITSQSNQYFRSTPTSADGDLSLGHLPFGIYQIEIHESGFADLHQPIEIRSSIPVRSTIQLKVAAAAESVTVRETGSLLPLDQAGAVNRMSTSQIESRTSSIPGRSVQDLVNSQPGWLYEGNAVLHPRGSEYQTQFVIDGIPLTDNRSPSFGPEIEADDVKAMSVYTAGIPAEYGRKMGGVVEVETLEDSRPGVHGEAVLSGGSFASYGAFAKAQFSHGKNTLGASSSGSETEHYLNPVVPQNYSNTGTLGDFSANYERDLSTTDKFGLIFRHELARYDIPNEMIQQAAGQRQTADNFETMGIASYQHLVSDHASIEVHAMFRDNSNDFNSNSDSTPIQVSQHNSFREVYFKADAVIDHSVHEWKMGVESDSIFLHEQLNYFITDPTQFDPGTPSTFDFVGSRPDLEQSAFLQDSIHLKLWTIAAGLRWDRYQLLLNRQSLQPRFAVSRYIPSASAVVHFSYDRVFQTPSFENILLSSSAAVESIDPTNFLRLPVKPSVGDYYEAGLSKAFAKQIRIDTNYFRRVMADYADDDQIDNTAISFPIAFRKAIIYGGDVKVDLPDWHHFSGTANYSYTVGNAWFPVTGGLFLGDNATAAAAQLTGHFPDSQDQRNTGRGRIRYQVIPRFWVAGGFQFDSGLPFEFDGDPSTVLAQYGQSVLSRLNFSRGRIDPAFQVNASAGATLTRSDRWSSRLQVDGENLNNVLNVLDFGGLFSGNAIGPSRSYSIRWTTTF